MPLSFCVQLLGEAKSDLETSRNLQSSPEPSENLPKVSEDIPEISVESPGRKSVAFGLLAMVFSPHCPLSLSLFLSIFLYLFFSFYASELPLSLALSPVSPPFALFLSKTNTKTTKNKRLSLSNPCPLLWVPCSGRFSSGIISSYFSWFFDSISRRIPQRISGFFVTSLYLFSPLLCFSCIVSFSLFPSTNPDSLSLSLSRWGTSEYSIILFVSSCLSTVRREKET